MRRRRRRLREARRTLSDLAKERDRSRDAKKAASLLADPDGLRRWLYGLADDVVLALEDAGTRAQTGLIQHGLRDDDLVHYIQGPPLEELEWMHKQIGASIAELKKMRT